MFEHCSGKAHNHCCLLLELTCLLLYLKHLCVCSDTYSDSSCSLLCSEVYTGPDLKRPLNLTFDSYCDMNLSLSLSCTALVCHIRLLPWELWICAILQLVLLLHILTRYGTHHIPSSLLMQNSWVELLSPVYKSVCVRVVLT